MKKAEAAQSKAEFAGAGEGNRTLVFSLEGCCSTIELHPHCLLFINQCLSKRNPFFKQLYSKPEYGMVMSYFLMFLVS
jgi:hypothetical protein